MNVYFAITLSSTFLSALSVPGARTYIFLIIASACAYVGAFGTGIPDWYGYEEMYWSAPQPLETLSGEDVPSHGERGWYVISGIAQHWIGMSYEWFRFTIIFGSVYLKLRVFARYAPYIIVSVPVYMTQMMYMDTQAVRNGLATAVLLYALIALIERNRLKSITIFIVACFIHSAALSFLLVYAASLFWNRNWFPSFLAFAVIASITVGFIGLSEYGIALMRLVAGGTYIDAKITGYLQHEKFSAEAGVLRGSTLVSAAVILTYWWKHEIIEMKASTARYFATACAAAIIYLSAFSDFVLLGNRMFSILMPSLFVLASMIFLALERNSRTIVMAILVPSVLILSYITSDLYRFSW